MENTLEFNLKSDPEKVVANIAKMAREYKIFFTGDAKSGSFAGGPHILGLNFRFKGTYQVKGKKVFVTVTEKPALVSWNQTHDFLRQFLEQ